MGHPRIAWVLIATLVCLNIVVQRQPSGAANQVAVSQLQRNILEMQGQYLVAAAQAPAVRKSQLYQSARPLNSGPLFQRLAFVVIAGELMGPDEALRQLNTHGRWLARTPSRSSTQQRQALSVLRKLYADYQQEKWQAPSVSSAERQLLHRELGWFGALAFAPETPQPDTAGSQRNSTAHRSPPHLSVARQQVLATAWRTFGLVLVAIMTVLGMCMVGVAGAVLFLALTLSGRIASRITTGFGNSGIYAETFALWMLVLTGLSFVAVVLPHPQEYRLLYSAAASLMSLAVIAWPVMRGVTWPVVRVETGLFLPPQPWRETLWGAVCYASSLPLIALGFAGTLSLFRLQQALVGNAGGLDELQAPTHPIVEWVREAGSLDRIIIVVLACVIAPFVEEALFRGVLYRHLRDATVRWRTGISVLFSAVANSLIFAIIHPQGLLAAPVLTAIAVGLSLSREWRGSLLTPMTMHAINNGTMLIMLFALA